MKTEIVVVSPNPTSNPKVAAWLSRYSHAGLTDEETYDSKSGDWTVTLKDGNEETFSLLEMGELEGKQAKLQGLLAKVPAGWKLFPLHCLGEVDFEEAK